MSTTTSGQRPIDVDSAMRILRQNDRGGYSVPTDGLYPFQWSWDSAITALGWMKIDERRAWQEAETMFRGQWDNGMVPHILFHKDAESYFPGPDVWGSDKTIPSSAISQPPVWATAIRFMYEQAGDRSLAEQKLRELLPKLIAYHEWWYRERDPDSTGLVCSYHPWESGMDNSPAWDKPLGVVPEVEWTYQRRDLGHVDAEQRPHKPEYDRYLYLVDFYKRHGFDSQYIYEHCPYKVIDIGIVSILQRASDDLLELCRIAGHDEGVPGLEKAMARTKSAVKRLWSSERRCFLNHDLISGHAIDEVTTATVLPLFGGLANAEQAAAMVDLIDSWLDATRVGLSSTHPSSPRYESQRYWRGPVWLHINWMIALGAEGYGYPDLARRLRDSTRDCVTTSGFWEYFDADTGEGCGGDNFTWTAAVALYWLGGQQQ